MTVISFPVGTLYLLGSEWGQYVSLTCTSNETPWSLSLSVSLPVEWNKRIMLQEHVLKMWHSVPIVKWQNTTRSWSREPELAEGTWLQLMCCAPSWSHCPKFRSNGVHGVYGGIPEYTGEDGEDGETRGLCKWVHYGQYTNWSYHTWLFVYVSMGMNVSTKRKDNKTVMGHNKHNNQKWNITRSPEFGSEISLRTENNRTEQENNKMTFPNEEGQD